jgi:predicted ATP-binding protein involved in virulence
MITEIKLFNFRGFDSHTIPLRPITIIVGKNNAGNPKCSDSGRRRKNRSTEATQAGDGVTL